jgi:hypothetical protein
MRRKIYLVTIFCLRSGFQRVLLATTLMTLAVQTLRTMSFSGTPASLRSLLV